jgi:hypothetical protein
MFAAGEFDAGDQHAKHKRDGNNMNTNQTRTVQALTAALVLRGFADVTLEHVSNETAQVNAPSYYRIKADSVCLSVLNTGKTFPIIEIRSSGLPALPEISTYDERGNKTGAFIDPENYSKVADWHELTTSFDNALFGDLHIGKVRKSRSGGNVFPKALGV